MHSEFNIILTDQSANTQVSILLARQRNRLVENPSKKEFSRVVPVLLSIGSTATRMLKDRNGRGLCIISSSYLSS